MVLGQVAGVNPENWRIVDGKLYLGYSKAAMAKWDEKPVAAVQESLKQADARWNALQQR